MRSVPPVHIALRDILCCPDCMGALESLHEAYRCTDCETIYPVVMGIPDFRVFPDRYIDRKDDYAKARFILDEAGEGTLEDLVRFYWSITPDATPEQAERFMSKVFDLGEKWKELLPTLEKKLSSRGAVTAEEGAAARRPSSVLEIGCGTGGFLEAATHRYDRVIGVDIAFRWLVVARRRLELAGLDVPLVCACAEHLPFKPDSFDMIVSEAVIEHVVNQSLAVAESRRVLQRGGALYIETSNRFSLLPEPHVDLWGVGFVPRTWASKYVHAMKGLRYEYLRPVSWWEIKRMLRKTGYSDVSLIHLPVSAAESRRLHGLMVRLASMYEWICRIPIAGWFARAFGPVLHIRSANDSPVAPASLRSD